MNSAKAMRMKQIMRRPLERFFRKCKVNTKCFVSSLMFLKGIPKQQ